MASTPLHLSKPDRSRRPDSLRRANLWRGYARHPRAHRGCRWQAARLRRGHGGRGRGAGQGGGRRDRRRAPSRSAAWRADRGQGSLLHLGHADPRRHAHLQRFRTGVRRHGGGALPRGRRGHSRQTGADRKRLRVSPSRYHAARQSLALWLLDRGVVERLGRRDRGRAVLCLARLRYRGFDPLPQCGVRRDRAEADLGPGQQIRRLPALRFARPHRPDDAHGGRRRGGARRHRRRRRQRPDHTARPGARLSGRN